MCDCFKFPLSLTAARCHGWACLSDADEILLVLKFYDPVKTITVISSFRRIQLTTTLFESVGREWPHRHLHRMSARV